MQNESARVAAIYEGKLAARYDRKMSHFFDEKKREALNHTQIGTGDRVLVMCCGTGRDFAPIEARIGDTGAITAVDRSGAMISQARARAKRHGWSNIAFIHDDACGQFSLKGGFDVAVCTLSLSTIPQADEVYEKMLAAVRPGGYLVVGDMQLASGWRWVSNLISVPLSRSYGGSWQGHGRSRALSLRMQRELDSAVKHEFVFGAYQYCVGRKP